MIFLPKSNDPPGSGSQGVAWRFASTYLKLAKPPLLGAAKRPKEVKANKNDQILRNEHFLIIQNNHTENNMRLYLYEYLLPVENP